MSDRLALTLAGETVWLHGDRALFYPEEGALLVADTHFGKGAFLRRQGLALPGGQSAAGGLAGRGCALRGIAAREEAPDRRYRHRR